MDVVFAGWGSMPDLAGCCEAGGDVMTKWQLPIGCLAAVVVGSGGAAGVGLGVGVACSAVAGFSIVWSARAWLVTSGATRNK